jgi:hypothetical protein
MPLGFSCEPTLSADMPKFTQMTKAVEASLFMRAALGK